MEKNVVVYVMFGTPWPLSLTVIDLFQPHSIYMRTCVRRSWTFVCSFISLLLYCRGRKWKVEHQTWCLIFYGYDSFKQHSIASHFPHITTWSNCMRFKIWKIEIEVYIFSWINHYNHLEIYGYFSVCWDVGVFVFWTVEAKQFPVKNR